MNFFLVLRKNSELLQYHLKLLLERLIFPCGILDTILKGALIEDQYRNTVRVMYAYHSVNNYSFGQTINIFVCWNQLQVLVRVDMFDQVTLCLKLDRVSFTSPGRTQIQVPKQSNSIPLIVESQAGTDEVGHIIITI